MVSPGDSISVHQIMHALFVKIILCISFDSSYPVTAQDGFQLVAGVTLASPFGATNPSGPHRPTLDLRGLHIARTAPGTSTSYRNLRVLSPSMSISWALTEAPATLPGVPRYAAWRSM